MKEYIVLTILNNTLVFNYRPIDKEEKVFLNKNGLYKDSLFYTLKYFKKNNKKIAEILKNNCNSLNTFKILRLVTFKYTINIIEQLNLENLVLDFLSTIDLKDYDLFLQSASIKNIYCYFMPSGIVKKFNSKGINVYMASIKQISNNFLSQQDVIDNDTLYYKNIVKIKNDYPGLLEDLKEFLKINYNLKAIHIYVYYKELISSIVDLVKGDESKNVVIFLHQGYDKGNFIVNNFEWLKELSDKCKEDYTCEFRIVYSNNFLKNNLFKQLTLNNLKLISVLAVYVCIVSLIIVKAYEYIEEISVQQLKTQMIGASGSNAFGIDDYEVELSDDDEDDDYEEDENQTNNDLNNNTSNNTDNKKEVKSKYTFENSLNVLKKINNETKAYLIVRNTEISYPVVQHSDNNYYLKYDFYKKKASMGWVFFDYRNNIEKLDDNTIAYGHSMKNGTMFGTLKKVLNSTWRKNDDNMIITLDTDKGSYKFKIFSAYKVDYTTDYLRVNFDSREEKEDFIKLIRGRSAFKSNEIVSASDKILTLSTCAGGNNRRLVVHAVLMSEEE